MIRTIAKEIKEYKWASIATPLFMLLEVLMETLIPYLMASIIDKGVNAGDIGHIYRIGGLDIGDVSRQTGHKSGCAEFVDVGKGKCIRDPRRKSLRPRRT